MNPYALPPAETRLPVKAVAGGYLAASSEFSERFAEFTGAQSCILANSGRALLYLLLRYLGSQSGWRGRTEILIPGYTCYSVPAAAVKAGLKVSLYDMDPITLQPDMVDVGKKLSRKTLAVVGQHLLGVHLDITGLAEVARRNGVYCIEDSAQRLEPSPDESKGQKADFTLFSFGRGKPLPLGAGGALISRDSEALPIISRALEKSTGNYLFPIFAPILSQPRIYWILEKLPLGLGRTVYDPTFHVGGMPAIYNRIGSRSLESVENMNKHRIEIGQIYHSHFTRKNSLTASSPCVRFPLLVSNSESTGQLSHLGLRRLYPLALCDLPPLRKNLADRKAVTPGARAIAERLVTLPTHMSVSEWRADQIAKKVKETFQGIALVEENPS